MNKQPMEGKYNPFDAGGEEQDLEIKTAKEMDEAKKMAGVVTEEEHEERMQDFFKTEKSGQVSSDQIVDAWKGVEHELNYRNMYEIIGLILTNKLDQSEFVKAAHQLDTNRIISLLDEAINTNIMTTPSLDDEEALDLILGRSPQADSAFALAAEYTQKMKEGAGKLKAMFEKEV